MSSLQSSLTKPDNSLHDCNVVITEKILNSFADCLIKCLLRTGVTPKKLILNNEITHYMKDHITDKYHFTLKLVSPGCHYCNAAKVAICDFKEHFLSVIAGAADSFPCSLWDHLLPQTKIMLNLLHQSNAMPTILAYAHLSCLFDYNKMPLDSMECEVHVHKKTEKLGTWAFYCVDVQVTRRHCWFQYNDITNFALTPTDKLMRAIADCKADLTTFPASPQDTNHCDLQTLVDQAHAKINTHHTQPAIVLRVPDPITLITIDPPSTHPPPISPSTASLPRVPIPNTLSTQQTIAQQTCHCPCLLNKAATPIFLPSQPPALSMQSRVHAATASLNQPTVAVPHSKQLPCKAPLT
ncbi:LOW QUALITY PROTEIN: hypothetical protein ACHAW6_010409 [Cyclotella cf. meneghiniana]